MSESRRRLVLAEELLEMQIRELVRCHRMAGAVVGDDPCANERAAAVALRLVEDAARTALDVATVARATAELVLTECEAGT